MMKAAAVPALMANLLLLSILPLGAQPSPIAREFDSDICARDPQAPSGIAQKDWSDMSLEERKQRCVHMKPEMELQPPSVPPAANSLLSTIAPSRIIARPVPGRTSSIPSIDPLREKYLRILFSRVRPNGTRPEAAAEIRRLMRLMLGRAEITVLERLVSFNSQVDIIPADRKLTDLPRFAKFRGEKTPDGRPWEEARGMGYQWLVEENGATCAVAEENLLSGRNSSQYPKDFIFLHEYSHMIHRLALPRTIYNRISETYLQSLQGRKGTGLGSYADSSVWEAFAEASSAYFGISDTKISPIRLRKENESFFHILQQIYGS